ncbi:MAG: LysR family transcriptional regulator [Syntrophorhabdales bacterium]|jgi:molybdate transport system regulatory protein
MGTRKDGRDMPADPAAVLCIRLWLETEKGLLFGPGRADLLDGIERHGSLRKAAREFSISYRAAWGKIRRTEEILGFKLVYRSENLKEGYRLTDAGRKLKEGFDRWYREVQDDALKKARAIFTFDIMPSEEAVCDPDKPETQAPPPRRRPSDSGRKD